MRTAAKFFQIICWVPIFLSRADAQSLHLTWQPQGNINHLYVSGTLPASGWKLYFNLRYHGYDLRALSDRFDIVHVNGELFYLAPSAGFKGLRSGDTALIPFTGTGRIADISDAPSGFFLVNNTSPNEAADISDYRIEPPVGNDTATLTLAKIEYAKNERTPDIAENELPPVLPTPLSWQRESGVFQLNAGVSISADSAFKDEAAYLVEEFPFLRNGMTTVEHTRSIRLRKRSDLPGEGYSLLVTPMEVVVEAADAAGAFYGIQSLRSLLPPGYWDHRPSSVEIPCVNIKDAPRFPIRAFMLDVSRNFQPKEEILRILELMAMYKLNVFHLHFSDDEGWRLEIPGLPELTSVGSKRGYPFAADKRLQPSYGSGANFNGPPGSGYYSTHDFIDILRYATQRHILVIPEIETPGHARAAVTTMTARYRLHDPKDASHYRSNQGFNDGVMDITMPSTLMFMEKVIDELIRMYKKAGAPLTTIHIGGDEVPEGVWAMHTGAKTRRDLESAYVHRLQAILQRRGLGLEGWEDIAIRTPAGDQRIVERDTVLINAGAIVDAWWSSAGEKSESVPYQLANNGYKVVLTNIDYFYFDLAWSPAFEEPGDGWVGYQDLEKILSFRPFDWYANTATDIAGNPLPGSWSAGKESLTATGMRQIAGVQGALWGENTTSSALAEYLLIPKLLALAEVAWGPQTNWPAFANELGKRELPKLSFYKGGYAYRIAPPGIDIQGGKVLANVELPGEKIVYTTDGSDPGPESAPYTGPLDAAGSIKIRVTGADGHESRVITIRMLPSR